MSRPNHRWRDDRLGTALRAGLSGARTAVPSAGVWDRIEAELAPPRSRWDPVRVLQRFAADPRRDGRSGIGFLPWFALPGATVLSLLVLLGLALGTPSQSPWSVSMTADSAVAGPVSSGLSGPELAMQPELDRRLANLALPPGPLEREAPPRLAKAPRRAQQEAPVPRTDQPVAR